MGRVCVWMCGLSIGELFSGGGFSGEVGMCRAGSGFSGRGDAIGVLFVSMGGMRFSRRVVVIRVLCVSMDGMRNGNMGVSVD